MNQLLLELLVRSVAPALRGTHLSEVRHLAPLMSLALGRDSKREGGRFFGVVISNPGPFAFIDGDDPLGGLGEPVFRRIWGACIADVFVRPGERVVRFALTGAEAPGDLVVPLFGGRARVRLATSDTIIESLDPREAGTPVRTHPNRPGPGLATRSPVDITEALCKASDARPVVPGLTDEFAGGFRRASGDLDVEALVRFRDGLVEGNVPFVLGTRGRPSAATPLPAEAVEYVADLRYRWGPFARAEEACVKLGRALVSEARELIVGRLANVLRKHLDGRVRLLEKLESQLERAKGFAVGRTEADTLAAYQSTIPPGARHIDLPDLYNPGRTVGITLDPSLPVDVQIKRRYKRAAKLERSQALLDARIGTLKGEIEQLEQRIEATERAPFADAVRDLDEAIVRHGLIKQKAPKGRRDDTRKRYRRFDLDERWFVLVGRSDEENDELTFRVSGPDDIWMHAQQVAGSHVVLRSSGGTGNPPADILDAAAGVAAFYSKAKNSNLVPVVYTRRKYVRKFRGAKPGEVLCEREKTIVVRPRLPGS